MNLSHKAGQYRAELFEQFVGLLIRARFPNQKVYENFLLPKEWHYAAALGVVDYFVLSEQGHATLVEAKAPYSGNPSWALRRAARYLMEIVNKWPPVPPIDQVIVAFAGDIPQAARAEFSIDSQSLAARNIAFDIWDASRLRAMSLELFHIRPASFSGEDILKVMTIMRETVQSYAGVLPGLLAETSPPAYSVIREGERSNVITLVADFRSYSKFVDAAQSDPNLVMSIMERFYRETRRVVVSCRGAVDKYLGDGILAFWFPEQIGQDISGSMLNSCIYRLVGTAMSISKEWQDQIDKVIEPTGMRFGAASGNVLFISETHDEQQPIHAIGESINLAARLQAEAATNTLLISNRLRRTYFAADSKFTQTKLELKNIGPIRAWQKAYEIDSVEFTSDFVVTD